jgi:dTDP-4-dehydro-6-deoxy-alpha-D-glucopyranose 2,3-dehydratase
MGRLSFSDSRIMMTDPFLHSALTTDSEVMPLAVFHDWLDVQRQQQGLEIRRIPFDGLDQWHFTASPCSLAHRSGKFFTVEGLRVDTDFGPAAAWEQPIIHQPEIGILGIVSRKFGGILHFLMQAKIEPGNINGVQLVPTVQATRSNYTQVHGGRQPPYSRLFTEKGRARILVDRLLGEQGARFLRKRNRNMIVEVDEEIPLENGFCWLTLGQIKQLLREGNLVNMSARSVLSCVPFSTGASPPDSLLSTSTKGFGSDLIATLYGGNAARHPDNDILNWLFDLRARYSVRLQRLPLDRLDGWIMDKDEIRHHSGRHFSVIAVQVEAIGREVVRWSQPLLQHSARGLNGFLLQRIGGVLHFLVRACLFPGNNEIFNLGSTVSRANAESHFGTPDAPPFLDLFRDPPPSWIRYLAVQSEEGGRFLCHQSRYVILELPSDIHPELPENFRWMTLGQLNTFNQHGHVNIEGRNLLACLDYSDTNSVYGVRTIEE